MHLPPTLVAALANHPRGLERPGERLFRLVKCGRLYTRLERARKAAGPDLAGTTFHTLRHTWAAWMRRYGGLDTSGLVATDAWRDRASAARYEHVVASEEARRADLRAAERRRRRCEACGTEFVARSPSGAARRGEVAEGRFCSRACAASARRVYPTERDRRRAEGERARARAAERDSPGGRAASHSHPGGSGGET